MVAAEKLAQCPLEVSQPLSKVFFKAGGGHMKPTLLKISSKATPVGFFLRSKNLLNYGW